MSERVVAIVNPRSNLGATGERLAALRQELDHKLRGAPYELWLTEGPAQGGVLAQKAIAGGATHLIACGGDGTISEVVDGIMRSGRAAQVALSVVPRGTGSDFMRSLRARTRNGGAQEGELWLDVGRVELTRDNGEPVQCHLLNVASLGVSAEAVRWIDAQGRRGKRNRLSYLLSAFVGLHRYRVSEIEVSVDGALFLRAPLQTVAVANGGFYGGGMPVAPEACLDDGWFDVICIAPLAPLQVLPFFTAFLRGRHLGHRLTRATRGREVRLSSAQTVWLEIDGEPVGRLPARIALLPKALRVRVLK